MPQPWILLFALVATPMHVMLCLQEDESQIVYQIDSVSASGWNILETKATSNPTHVCTTINHFI